MVKANQILQAELAQQLKQGQQLRSLLKETHHRVKNNLQIVSSLLGLQASYTDDAQVIETFNKAQQRIRSMSLIHQNLYLSDNLAQIDAAEYIHTLAAHLIKSYTTQTEINLEVTVEHILLEAEIAVPCGLILNELISNAFKYAFPAGQGGKIQVKLWLGPDHHLNLIVADNGVGFPEGLDFYQANSLGLKLVNSFVQQLEGTMTLNRREGTEFKITFPLPHQAEKPAG